AKQISPRIADLCDICEAVTDDRRGERGSHSLQFGMSLSVLPDMPVGILNSLFQAETERSHIRALRQFISQCHDGQFAGHLTGRCAAQPIRYHQQSPALAEMSSICSRPQTEIEIGQISQE